MPNRIARLTALLLAVALTFTATLQSAEPAAAEEPVGHLPTAEDFVVQQYEDFLARSPDAAGLAYWTGQLRSGVDPSMLVESLVLGQEFNGTIAPLVRLYSAHFQRPPDYDGLTYWAGVARSGTSLDKISELFVRSGEFQSTYGALSDTQYVEQVYQNVLGRPADAGGAAYWQAQLTSGTSRGALMVAFSESEEYRRASDGRVLATMLYVGMLRRTPEANGLDYWAGVVASGVPARNVVAGFLGADEYGKRIDTIYREVQPLTGVPTRQSARRAALAVKIDNVDQARPQVNLHRADIVYEEMVEGNLTRLVAVFHSDLPHVVGPVRSIRTTDIDILDQLNRPLLAASGANAGVLSAIADADVINVNALEASGAYYRDRSRRAPHNMFANTVGLYEAADSRGGLPPQLFRYRAPGQAPAGGVATGGVSISFGRADIEFAWSPLGRGWDRTQNGRAHTTSDGTRLSPENVVVLEVGYGVSAVDANSPEAHTVGSGTAHVFTAGKRVAGTWSRSASDAPIRLLDGSGNDIELTRGQTFVELAPAGTITIR